MDNNKPRTETSDDKQVGDDKRIHVGTRRDDAAQISLPNTLKESDAQTPGAIGSDIEQAKRVLDSIPDLSEEQIRNLKQRIADGYYANPEITAKISEEISKQLGTDSVERRMGAPDVKRSDK